MRWDDYAATVGARLRRLRKSADLTIEELAEASGVGAVYLGSVERGGENPTLKVLHAVAGALGLSVAQLVDIDADLAPGEVKKEMKARLEKATPEDLQLVLRVLGAVRGS